MPAILRVITGPAAGHEYWIADPVFRIGSDPGCDWSIPGVDPHVLTIQFRDNRYWAINRGSRVVERQGEPISPGQQLAWEPDQQIRIGSTFLWLWTDGDCRPSPRPRIDPTHDDEARTQENAASSAVAPPARKPPWLVAAVGLGLIAFLAASHNRRSGYEGDSNVTFETLAVEMPQCLHRDNPLDGHLQATIQEARRFEVRQQWENARLRYKAARDLLLARARDDGKLVAAFDHRAAAFVEARILDLAQK